MTVYCNRCGEELAAPGGILLGPPELGGRCDMGRRCCRMGEDAVTDWLRDRGAIGPATGHCWVDDYFTDHAPLTDEELAADEVSSDG